MGKGENGVGQGQGEAVRSRGEADNRKGGMAQDPDGRRKGGRAGWWAGGHIKYGSIGRGFTRVRDTT